MFTLEESQPLRLFSEIFQDSVIRLSQQPQSLQGAVAREHQLAQIDDFLCEGLLGAAVGADVQHRLSLKYPIQGPQTILQPVARVDYIDLGACNRPPPPQ